MKLTATCSTCGVNNSATIQNKFALLSRENCSHFVELWKRRKLFAFIDVSKPTDPLVVESR